MDSGRVFEIWKKLVPTGTFSQERVLPRKAGEYAHVSFVYDDGKGAGLVEFRMGRADLRAGAAGCEPADQKCHADTLSDGGRMLSVASHAAPYTTTETKSDRWQIITPEGFFVEATVWNTPDPKLATGTRKVPVLNYDLYRLNANEWRNELKKFPLPDPLEGEPPLDPSFVTPTGRISGGELLGTFKGLLPKGTFSQEQGRGTADQLGPRASFVYDDGKGRAFLSAELYRVDPHGFTTRQRISCRPVSYCTATKTADGSKVRVYKEEYERLGNHLKFWTATHLSPQGHMVEVSAWNTTTREGAEATRDTPPLTVGQLQALVSSPKWQPALDELPAAPDEKTGGSTLPNEESRRHLDNLNGTHRAMKEGRVKACGSGCWSQITVNHDGLGPGIIQVRLDAKKVNTGTEPRLSIRQEQVKGGGKGVIRWIVTASQPGGREVTVTAYNAPAPDADATRTSPPVNVPMLKAIALDPEWDNAVFLRMAEETLPTG
ncbi:hypothetical protein [Streptomyces sp. NPDC019890]|uniref:hypothetical protein n=1 Tax=Streptomyces sp. NPDC019890 TaxID=3365064 RepID=UPI00384EDF56